MRDGTQQPRSSALNGKVAARPILRRATQEPPITSVRLATGGAASFAESILARYSGRSGQRLRSNLIYQRPGPGWIFQRVLHRSSPQLSLRLALHFTAHSDSPSGQFSDVRSDTPAARAPALPLKLATSGNVPAVAAPNHAPTVAAPDRAPTQPAMLAAAPMRLPVTRGAPIEAAYRRGASRQVHDAQLPVKAVPLALAFDSGMTRQITAREQRLAMVQSAGRPVPGSPATRPVPRVVHRPQAAPEPAQTGQRRGPFGGDDFTSGEFPAGLTRLSSSRTPGWPGTDSTSITPAGLAPHQVQRLADQVVQIIDDRTIARRERVGRV